MLAALLLALLAGAIGGGYWILQAKGGIPHPAAENTEDLTLKKVVVLGFDGADAALTERWMNELNPDTGRPWLENLAALRDSGGYSRLDTSYPAQTPVAWSVASVSGNPGMTGIADFVTRDPATMTPDLTLLKKEWRVLGVRRPWRWLLALAAGVLTVPLWAGLARRFVFRKEANASPWRARGTGLGVGFVLGLCFGAALSGWVPERVPVAKNLRQGVPIWKALEGTGARTVMLKWPMTFPAEQAHGLRTLSGFGVPDATGWPYSWTLLRHDHPSETRTETLGVVRGFAPAGAWREGLVDGPANPLRAEPSSHAPDKERDTPPMPVKVVLDQATGTRCRVGNSDEQTLVPNQWSGPIRFSMSFSPLATLHLQTRVFLRHDGDDPSKPILLVGPLQFDPARLPPNLELSQPPGYAAKLARATGGYNTVGWQLATHPAKDGKLDDEGFMRDVAYAWRCDEALFEHELAGDDWDLLMTVFSQTDRAGHILWRHLSKAHPLHDPAQAAAGEAALRDTYVRMDTIVGKARARAKALDAEVLVFSDHGFAAFDWQVHLNSALRDAGLLQLRDDSLPADARQVRSGENLARIDFSKTMAYALGLGGVYLNMQGREHSGIVDPAEREMVLGLVEKALLGLKNPVTGETVVSRVVRNEAVYRGPHAEKLPDLLVCFKPGYRVSWATSVGGAPQAVIEPNASAWSGDHCSVDPEFVPGVVFCSKKWTPREPRAGLADMAPTIFELMGVAGRVPASWEGRPLSPEKKQP